MSTTTERVLCPYCREGYIQLGLSNCFVTYPIEIENGNIVEDWFHMDLSLDDAKEEYFCEECLMVVARSREELLELIKQSSEAVVVKVPG